MRVLAIETSCDETAAAIVEDRCRILSDRVASQVDVHKAYGGVVPELASRCHIETIDPIVRSALEEARCDLASVDAVAATRGPGLVGSLLVGLSFAKAVAFARSKPLVGVNHLEGHIRAAFIENRVIPFPAVALVVSGGHTALYLLPEEGSYTLLAKTRDDAAGEAYDKVAKLLGLGYPGGPIIDAIAPTGDDARFAFPLPRMSDRSLDFSFSGLKTAALRFAQAEGLAFENRTLAAASPEQPPGAGEVKDDLPRNVRDLCASFQKAAVRLLVDRTARAAEERDVQAVIISGGVACNSRLRSDLSSACAQRGWPLFIPSPRFCTDNAAMIASAAFLRLERGDSDPLTLDADPSLRLGGPESARATIDAP